MANSADPDQTALEGAVRSGSALFAYAIFSATLVYEILGHLPYLKLVLAALLLPLCIRKKSLDWSLQCPYNVGRKEKHR